jgi:hypothetical protein
MKPLVRLLLLAALASCGSEPAPPLPKAEEPRNAAPAPPAALPVEKAETPAASGDAAEVLRRYYALIEAGDYEEASRLRSRGTADARRLADNFKAYASYSAQVGAPSRPVEAGGWLYVEVPVMITGSFKGGKSFGSAGSVTLRRAASGRPAGDRQWRIYTGG